MELLALVLAGLIALGLIVSGALLLRPVLQQAEPSAPPASL